jgi:hypothetical protein
MNCADAQARLPGLLYGDLAEAEADAVRRHVAGCPSCQCEQAALAQVRRLLDAVPAPPGAIDLPRLYREAAGEQALRWRRWRRLAVVSLAAAAAVTAVVFLSRLEIRMDAHQVVLRWGAVPAAPEVPQPPVPRPEQPLTSPALPESSGEVEQQLRLLTALVQTLSEDADLRDGRQQQEIARLRAEMQVLRQQLGEQRLVTERDVAALYAAQFPDKQKGAIP